MSKVVELGAGITWNRRQKIGAEILGRSHLYNLFYGGSRAGKTFLACFFMIARCLKYPGSSHAIARHDMSAVRSSVWRKTLLPLLRPLMAIGLARVREQAMVVEFTNGSIISVYGLQPHRIEHIQGDEFATIFVNECSETKWAQIEPLFSRLNDTSVDDQGKRIPIKFVADENPPSKTHWSYRLFIKGENPSTGQPVPDPDNYATLHFTPRDNEANLTGTYLQTLENMSPARRRRFLEGEFGLIDGAVYDLKEADIIVPFPMPESWTRYRTIDFGYTHPFVCLWAAQDPNGDVYIYRELYRTGVTVAQNARKIHELSRQDHPAGEGAEVRELERIYQATISDHDAGDRATLTEEGIFTKAANKAVEAGIDNVIELIDKGALKVFKTCQNTLDEFSSYQWDGGFESAKKDRRPKKESDHAMDAIRYLVQHLFPRGINMVRTRRDVSTQDEASRATEAAIATSKNVVTGSSTNRTAQNIHQSRHGNFIRRSMDKYRGG